MTLNSKKKIFYHSEWQPAYTQIDKGLEFCEGIPQTSDFVNDLRPKLIIIDEFMRESSNNAKVDLFSKGSHHRNL